MIINAAKASEAAKILGVELDSLTPNVLSGAYRQAAAAAHPDAACENYDAQRWASVSWAKEVLIRWLERREKEEPAAHADKCRACDGLGRIPVSRATFGKPMTMLCVMCKGNGVLGDRDSYTGEDR